VRHTLAVVVAIVALAVGATLGIVAAFVGTSAGPTASPSPIAGVPSPTASPTPEVTPLPTPTPRPTPVPTPVPLPAPLTGRPVKAAVAAQRAIAVMIDDHSDARPQSGFNAAAIVWHAPAEGGIPRYMLVFQDTMPAAVGPVRSAREYYVEWASEWRAMYVHSGGSPQALATLRAKGQGQWVYNADEFRWGGKYLWRIRERFAPHNVYSDAEHLRALASRLGADDELMLPAWTFHQDMALPRRPVGGKISTAYLANRISYAYDRASNTYVRSVTGASPQIDAADGKRVAPKNVVIMLVRFGRLNDGHPEKKRLEAAIVGKGTAWIATNGHTVKGTWQKASITAPTIFYGPNGQPVSLTIGQTFIQVMPTGTKVTIADGVAPDRQPGTPLR
jgi:Protein of unknown function (DUF3048) N-terminal domain/Protein of unknown function (DUF3048) C-terminal domain